MFMFLHTETTAHSRSATYCKNGSAEHLFALINLCLLITRQPDPEELVPVLQRLRVTA